QDGNDKEGGNLAEPALGRMERYLRDAATLDADRRQDPPGSGPPGQSLVAGAALSDRPWADDLADAVRCPQLSDRLRFRRPSPRDRDQRGPDGPHGPGAPP